MALLRRPTIPVKWIMPLLVVNLWLINLGLSISGFPTTRIEQDIICKRHFNLTSDELLPEEDCHNEAIQRELNLIDIGFDVSATLCSALVSLPLGALADRIGRVPILLMSIFSLFLSEGFILLILRNWRQVPLRAVWAAGPMLLLGGGRGVAEAMVFTSISDVIAESKRATCFQWAVGAVLSAALFGPLMASHLAEISIWHPLYVELGLIAFGGLSLALFMPETLPKRDTTVPREGGSNTETLTSIKDTLKILFTRPAIYLLPGASLVMPAASSQYGIVMRLMPIQFNWPLERSALLTSLSAGVTLITLLLILPVVSYILHKKTAQESFQRDRILARASTVLFMFGSLFLLIISEKSLIILGLVISSLGSGVPTLCRTMIVVFKGEQSTGSVFGMLVAIEVLGLLIFQLIIGTLFNVGLGSWLGLPFCLGMAVSLITLVSTWMVRASKPNKTQEPTRSESQTNIVGQDAT